MRYHSTYRGVNIYRYETPGLKLPWTTVNPSFSADTLAGIKQLVKEYKQKGEKK